MDFLGVITGADPRTWVEAIGSHPALGQAALERRYNPFTKQAVDFPVSVQVIVDGRVVGSMGWSQAGANEIEVRGPADVVPVAEEIAALLGATFQRG